MERATQMSGANPTLKIPPRTFEAGRNSEGPMSLGIELRSGRITKATPAEGLRIPSHDLEIDLGTPQIGPYANDVLVTGVDASDAVGGVTLLSPDSAAIEGTRVD